MIVYIVGLVTTLGALAAASELTGLAKFLSLKMVKLASLSLPEDRREIRREEWLGEWEVWEGANLLRFVWSFGLLIAARRSAARAALPAGRTSLKGWRRVRQGDHRVIYVWLPHLQEVIWAGRPTLLLPFEVGVYAIDRADLMRGVDVNLTGLDSRKVVRVEMRAQKDGRGSVVLRAHATTIRVAATPRRKHSNSWISRRSTSIPLTYELVPAPAIRLTFYGVDTSGQQTHVGMATTRMDGTADITTTASDDAMTWHAKVVGGPTPAPSRAFVTQTDSIAPLAQG